MDGITRFQGEYAFLSNFYHCKVTIAGHDFITAEHAFQSAKAALTGDQRLVNRVSFAATAGEAKVLGRKLKIDVARWDAAKKTIMMEILLAKFGYGGELPAKLAATAGRQLVEGNTWSDDFWGAVPVQGTAADIAQRGMADVPLWAPASDSGHSMWLAGQNWLGRMLMMTREIVK